MKTKTLNELIKELCPNGVEYKSLKELNKKEETFRGIRIVKNVLVSNGKYPVFGGGTNIPFGNYDKWNLESDSVTINVAGSVGFVDYIKERSWIVDSRYAFLTNKVNHKFLYFALKNIEPKIKRFKKGAIPGIDMQQLLNLQIPIPPLEIQTKIVEILDKFTLLEKELEKELELRKKQYEYYRNKLLTFNKNEERELWEITMWNKKFQGINNNMQTSFNNFTKQISSKEMKNLYFSDKGLIRLLSTGNFDKCTDETKTFYIGEVLTIPGGGRINGLKSIKYHNGNFINSGNLLATSSNTSKYSLKYLWYWMNMKKDIIQKMFRGSGIPHPDMAQILKMKISIPSINDQNKIVKILDKFETLTNSFNQGLPKEINLRKTQYEYYRNKLLDFKILNNNKLSS